MNKFFTTIFIFASAVCFGQGEELKKHPKKADSVFRIEFSDLEKMTIKDHEDFVETN